MRSKKALLLCIVILTCLCWHRASAAGALSWEDCLKESRANHPDLVSAREKVNQAKASRGVSKSGLLPQVNADAGGSVSKTSGREQSESYSYGLGARQLLFDGFKASHDLAAADENIRSAAYNYMVVSSNVRLRLRQAFISLLAAQDFMGVSADILARREKNLELVRLRYQGGLEHKGSLLTAEANRDEARFEYEQARRSREYYERSLSRELGRTSFVPLTVIGELAAAPAEKAGPVFEDLVVNTPLLKQLAAQKEAARLGVKSARADFFPRVYASGSAGKSGDEWPPSAREWSLGVSVSFPLFQGGANAAALAKARAVQAQVQADEDSGRAGVILTLVRTWTAWQDATAQVLVQEKFLEASDQRAKIVEVQYKSGLATFNDWTIIEDALVRDRKALLNSKAAAMASLAEWQQAKGETLDE
jgi:outer membrane protein TolC